MKKGLKGGLCNVTACQKPDSAFYFNKSTEAYYCESCAKKINWPGGHANTMALYGTPLLCEFEPADKTFTCHFCQQKNCDIGHSCSWTYKTERWKIMKRRFEAYLILLAAWILSSRNVHRCKVVSRRDNNDMWYMAEQLESISKRMIDKYNSQNWTATEIRKQCVIVQTKH